MFIVVYWVIIKKMEAEMAGLMTEDEKVAIAMKVAALRKEGKKDEASALDRTIPMPPFMAKFWKDHIGVDGLLKIGRNLSEAEVAFGKDWLAH